MPEDLYDDGPATATMDEAPPKQDDKESAYPEGLLSKSFFGGKETPVGSYWEIKVVGEHDDEVRVVYSTDVNKAKESKESKPMKAPPMEKSDMDSYME